MPQPLNPLARTHLAMNPDLCGRILELGSGAATLELNTTEIMVADEHGLVHGGFIFSLADYAAMMAVNQPNVVLGAAQSKFLRPVKVGERVVADARIDRKEGKKIFVTVTVRRGDELVFEGEFTCFDPPKHVLDP